MSSYPRHHSALVRVVALSVALACSAPSAAAAQDRLVRRFGTAQGLASATVFSLAQDSTRFLWAGTASGLYRYDGNEMRRWAGDRIRGRVQAIVVPTAGRTAVLEESGSLWWLDQRAAVRAKDPRGAPLRDVVDITHGAKGGIWLLREGGKLWRRAADSWHEVDLADAQGVEPRRVFPRPGGGVDLATADEVWTLPPGGGLRRLAVLPGVESILSLPDGRRLLLSLAGDLHRLRGDTLRRVLSIEGRGIDLAVRGRSTWAAFDRYLARIPSDAPPEIIGPADGLTSGGPLLVDAEGSLWMGSFSGLHQFPEPETLLWSDAHGLPSAHARFLARTGDSVWVSTWQGTGLVAPGDTGWLAETPQELFTRGALAADVEGDLWAGTPTGLVELRPGRGEATRGLNPGSLRAADVDDNGFLWVTAGERLYRIGTGGFAPRGKKDVVRVGRLPPEASGERPSLTAALHDEQARLWVGAGERICRAPADSVIAEDDPGWTCWRIRGAVHFSAFYRTPAGATWAASPYAGVLRLRDGRWEPVPGAAHLPSQSVLNLVPSPSGGVWILGHGILRRVVADPGTTDGWRVVERLTAWHGLPGPGGRDLVEQPDGTLWITTSRGLARVPADVRYGSPGTPRVALVEARVDGERLAAQTVASLPHDRNRLELRFTALSYRDPSAVRYQARLGPDSDWSGTLAQPVVRWVDLRPGSYRAEVRASLDGVSWSPARALITFDVLPPWYLEPYWLAAFGFTGALLLLLAYRSRVNHLLRLERQRTRIAMDLHDEIGGALGSIGIHAGLLNRRDFEPPEVRRLARVISDTAEEVGTSLADIVWSLDPRIASLADLATRLEERGRRLFADDRTVFTVRPPRDWPDWGLPATLRRNVFLIGLEALRNAAVHADARRVVLSLEPVSPGTWRLAVRDDGGGLDPSVARDAEGLGLRSMRRRAGEIDATIQWRRPATGGTEVVLIFPIRGRHSVAERLRSGAVRARDRMNVLLRRR